MTVAEKEQFTKPGTANVSPADNKKLSGLKKHYAKMAHPFTACKRDQIKHGLTPDHANRRCAVLVDLIKGTTMWRGKGKTKEEEAIVKEFAREAWDFLAVATDLIGPHRVAEAVVTDNEVGLEGELIEALRNASNIVEAVPNWMLPRAARKKDFKPTDPEFDEKKHKRGEKGTTVGGKFVSKGSSGDVAQGAAAALPGGATPTVFDEVTRRRLIKFQKNKGISVDGKVGHQTVVAMRGGDATKVKPGPLTASDRAWLRKQTAKGNPNVTR